MKYRHLVVRPSSRHCKILLSYMQFLFLNRNNILLKITHGHIFFWIKVLAKNVSNGFNIRLPFQAASTQFSTTNLLTFIFFKCMTLELIHLIQGTHNGVTRTSYGSKVIDFTSAHAISTSVIFSFGQFFIQYHVSPVDPCDETYIKRCGIFSHIFLYNSKFDAGWPSFQAPTQKCKSRFSQGIDASWVSFEMISKVLQPELFRFQFHPLG